MSTHATVLKEIIGGGTVSFHAIFAKTYNSVQIGIFLSQGYFWQENAKFKSEKRHKEFDGKMFFTRTASEWFNETGLTTEQQMKLRKTLKQRGVLLEILSGSPAKLYSYIDIEALVLDISQYLSSQKAVLVDNRTLPGFKTKPSIGNKPKLDLALNQSTIKEESFDSKKEREGEQQPPPPDDFDSFMSEVDRLSVEAKKEKAPQVAPTPPTLYSGFKEVYDYLESENPGIFDFPECEPPVLVQSIDAETLPGAMIRTAEIIEPTNANQITIKTGMNSAGETYIFEHTERVVIPTPPHISLNMRPNANTPTQLRIAMENFYRDWPMEWSDGILKFSKGSQYTEERQGEILGLWACHAIKMNHGGNSYQQLNADLQKWFRGQKDFDRNYNSAQQKTAKKQGSPNAFGGDQSKYQEVQKF